MPTTGIHEEVAYLIANKYKKLDTSNFYLGAIAPDAVNINGLAEKEIRWESHLRNEDLDVWMNNVKKFYYENKEKNNEEFLLGYVLHIITDIIHDKYFYWPIRKKMDLENINKHHQHELLRSSMEEYDYQNEKEPFWSHIKEKLDNCSVYSIRNIKEEDLLAWKNKSLEKHNVSLTLNKYITKDDIVALTNKVEEEFKTFII